jgi:hypothetical protein
MGKRQRLDRNVFLLGRRLAGDVFADLKEVFKKCKSSSSLLTFVIIFESSPMEVKK